MHVVTSLNPLLRKRSYGVVVNKDDRFTQKLRVQRSPALHCHKEVLVRQIYKPTTSHVLYVQTVKGCACSLSALAAWSYWAGGPCARRKALSLPSQAHHRPCPALDKFGDYIPSLLRPCETKPTLPVQIKQEKLHGVLFNSDLVESSSFHGGRHMHPPIRSTG
jgi:hypothetical protein